jgi:hypothetical protein
MASDVEMDDVITREVAAAMLTPARVGIEIIVIATIVTVVAKAATGTTTMVLAQKAAMTSVGAMTVVMVAEIVVVIAHVAGVARVVRTKVVVRSKPLAASRTVGETSLASTRARVWKLQVTWIATLDVETDRGLPGTSNSPATSMAPTSIRARETINRGLTPASRRMTSATASKGPRRMATVRTANVRSAAAAVGDAGAVDAAAVAAAKVEVARAAPWGAVPRAVDPRTHLPRQPRRTRKETAATNRVAAKANAVVMTDNTVVKARAVAAKAHPRVPASSRRLGSPRRWLPANHASRSSQSSGHLLRRLRA